MQHSEKWMNYNVSVKILMLWMHQMVQSSSDDACMTKKQQNKVKFWLQTSHEWIHMLIHFYQTLSTGFSWVLYWRLTFSTVAHVQYLILKKHSSCANNMHLSSNPRSTKLDRQKVQNEFALFFLLSSVHEIFLKIFNLQKSQVHTLTMLMLTNSKLVKFNRVESSHHEALSSLHSIKS